MKIISLTNLKIKENIVSCTPSPPSTSDKEILGGFKKTTGMYIFLYHIIYPSEEA